MLHSAWIWLGSWATAASISPGVLRSALTKPSSDSVGSFRSMPITRAPSKRASRATSAPIPDDTPVIAIVLLRSFIGALLLSIPKPFGSAAGQLAIHAPLPADPNGLAGELEREGRRAVLHSDPLPLRI